ncbi:MAG TPA: phosphoenolpyruvate synthase [Candidatus Nanoarchaeia archaeon]|nr:phosphoenolpyruvate synthase [Candidatus Nanoarchaeia archaeon]
MDKATAFVLWFDQIGIEDVGYTGGKNASLGEMYRLLVPKGVAIPNGFAVTAHAYHYLLEKAGVKGKIKEILTGLDTSNMQQLQEKGHQVRALVRSCEFSPELRDVILSSYRDLCGAYNKDRSDVDVAVRSSATAEDLPDASFAGQQETYLNVRGDQALLESCKKCFASLFTNRAISYRVDKGFDHFSIGLSIGIQKMVRSDQACSGVMFSIDTESGFKDAVFLTASYGLGENIVQGAVNPDEFYIHKPTLKQGFKSIIMKKIGSKEVKMIYDTQGNKFTKNVPVDPEDRIKYCLNDDEILTLARWACVIEDHYTTKAGHFKPMDMEWAKDGVSGQLFIVQARPETVVSGRDKTKMEKYILQKESKPLVYGKSVGEKIGAGTVNVIRNVHDINQFKKGEVLVTEITDPDWEPIMKIASAIVTNRGGRTCHAAIVSRELGIPCIVGTENGTQLLKNGQGVTVDCSKGEMGVVWEGVLPFKKEQLDLANIPSTKTKIFINVGDPDQAFDFSFLPVEGVGLAREEFILNEYIRIHPLALLNLDKVTDVAEHAKILELTKGYADKQAYYIERLAQGIGLIAGAFYPRPVIVRMADFKSNEYANMLGGKYFEPKEDNPMIGWRGASRYYDPKYRPAFDMECKAFKKVRDEFGLKNVKIMFPMVRTIDEGKKCLAILKEHGLVQGKDGLEIYAMCEVPSNVLLAEQFLELFDGFSIGSNDLTQMTLAVDRDSELVSHVYDERNEAVKQLVKRVIEVANKLGKYIGICGQAPSDYPEFAEFLVECGIHSISLNPDVAIKTLLLVAKKEKQLGR